MTGKLNLHGRGHSSKEIGALPVDWEIKNLGDVAKVSGGGTPSTQIPEYWNGEINWFTPTEVGFMKYLLTSQRKITALGLQNSSASILPKNSILLTSRAGIGDLGILNIPACTNQGFQSLTMRNMIMSFYTMFCLQRKRKCSIKHQAVHF